MRVFRLPCTAGCLTLLTLALGAGSPALAVAAAPPPDGWRFSVTPYIWAAGMTGDVAVGSLPAQGVEASFSDITSVLDLGGMLTFEGRGDRWGFLFDAIYMDLEEDAATPREVYGDAEVGMTQQAYSLAGTWRVSEGKAPVDIVAGARYNDLALDLALTSGIAAGRRRSGSEGWWDALLGARVAWAFAGHWALVGYGEVSGGGANLSWQALAGIDWNFSKHLSGRFGYRCFSLDYDQDDLLYDMNMAGPYAGLGIRF